jgi:hypothetical protein
MLYFVSMFEKEPVARSYRQTNCSKNVLKFLFDRCTQLQHRANAYGSMRGSTKSY